jgi:type III secretion system low calcium response chaperone LcrH/SycD
MDFVNGLEEWKETLGVKEGKPFSKYERETLYAAAFGKYEIGEYAEASDFFTHLILHEPYDPRFWKGLAAAHQMQKEYRAALHAWAVHALLSKHSSDSHFHAAECYLSLGEIEEAKKALHLADPKENRVQNFKEHLDGRSC